MIIRHYGWDSFPVYKLMKEDFRYKRLTKINTYKQVESYSLKIIYEN